MHRGPRAPGRREPRPTDRRGRFPPPALRWRGWKAWKQGSADPCCPRLSFQLPQSPDGRSLILTRLRQRKSSVPSGTDRGDASVSASSTASPPDSRSICTSTRSSAPLKSASARTSSAGVRPVSSSARISVSTSAPRAAGGTKSSSVVASRIGQRTTSDAAACTLMLRPSVKRAVNSSSTQSRSAFSSAAFPAPRISMRALASTTDRVMVSRRLASTISMRRRTS